MQVMPGIISASQQPVEQGSKAQKTEAGQTAFADIAREMIKGSQMIVTERGLMHELNFLKRKEALQFKEIEEDDEVYEWLAKIKEKVENLVKKEVKRYG